MAPSKNSKRQGARERANAKIADSHFCSLHFCHQRDAGFQISRHLARQERYEIATGLSNRRCFSVTRTHTLSVRWAPESESNVPRICFSRACASDSFTTYPPRFLTLKASASRLRQSTSLLLEDGSPYSDATALPPMASIGRETMVKIALEHARRAVELDTQAGSPRDAVDKYAMCVSLLNKVIEAMYRDGTDMEKTVDIARLVTIHNSYLDRIAVLCSRHGVPMPSTTSSNPLRR